MDPSQWPGAAPPLLPANGPVTPKTASSPMKGVHPLDTHIMATPSAWGTPDDNRGASLPAAVGGSLGATQPAAEDPNTVNTGALGALDMNPYGAGDGWNPYAQWQAPW